jgi:hypothetical protein
MFKKRKRSESEPAPLKEKVQKVVSQIGVWEDACGGRYTLECKSKLGDDYVDLEIYGVEEINLEKLSTLVKANSSIGSYVCVLQRAVQSDRVSRTGHLCLTFENKSSEARTTVLDEATLQKEVQKEFSDMKKYMTSESEEDILLAAKCSATVKTAASAVICQMITFGVTSTPGLITLVLTGMHTVDKTLCECLQRISVDNPLTILINVEKAFLQFNISKRRSTVNI